jgi:hypothetical protein
MRGSRTNRAATDKALWPPAVTGSPEQRTRLWTVTNRFGKRVADQSGLPSTFERHADLMVLIEMKNLHTATRILLIRMENGWYIRNEETNLRSDPRWVFESTESMASQLLEIIGKSGWKMVPEIPVAQKVEPIVVPQKSSKQTTYSRASKEEKAKIRRRALAIPCPYCKAEAGKSCVGMAGKPAHPHWERRHFFKNVVDAQ